MPMTTKVALDLIIVGGGNFCGSVVRLAMRRIELTTGHPPSEFVWGLDLEQRAATPIVRCTIHQRQCLQCLIHNTIDATPVLDFEATVLRGLPARNGCSADNQIPGSSMNTGRSGFTP